MDVAQIQVFSFEKRKSIRIDHEELLPPTKINHSPLLSTPRRTRNELTRALSVESETTENSCRRQRPTALPSFQPSDTHTSLDTAGIRIIPTKARSEVIMKDTYCPPAEPCRISSPSISSRPNIKDTQGSPAVHRQEPTTSILLLLFSPLSSPPRRRTEDSLDIAGIQILPTAGEINGWYEGSCRLPTETSHSSDPPRRHHHKD